MRRPVLLLGSVALALASLTACGKSHSTPPPERVAAQRFLAALGQGDASTAAQATTDPAAAEKTISASLSGLGVGSHGTLSFGALSARTSTSATASFTASWTVPGGRAPWTYPGQLPMVAQGHSWLVQWSPADLNPQLTAGQHLSVKRVAPARAALEDDDGQPLFTQTAIVNVGINPTLVKDLNSLAATLASDLSAYHVAAADIVASVKAAGAKAVFVPVITLRKTAYEQVRAKIHPLDGTVFTEGNELLGPTSSFAQPLLGHLGPASAQAIAESDGKIKAGDTIGVDGLQQALDAQLRGTAGLDVYATDADGTLGTKLGSAGPAEPSPPVQLTLDRTIQNAADAALAHVPQQASIVAVEPSTGKILAVANSASAVGDIALSGQFPPGSTFKIVTDTAAITANPKLTADTVVPCPPTITVDGRVFENENAFSVAGGQVPLREAFGRSCNTTAIDLGMALPSGALATSARALGLGADWKLPVDSFSGSVPPPAGQTEQAADAIGQGRVLVSPLLMAEIVAAADTGRSIAPSLIVGKQGDAGPAFPAPLTATMNELMAATVAQPYGTAYALHELPGTIVGKTGTAEYGTATPPAMPPTHSWFVGVRGDVAFSVFIYGGGTSSSGAVPVADTFLTALH